MAHTEIQTLGDIREVLRDPTLLLALVTGSALTAFLLVAHACCLGITEQHFLPAVQICSFAN
ncbi:hypothetical protein FMN63_25490 [Stappia sp. BW2]|uniref:hypothetical protein n=1 Tax=Stappia sp. BW2 TaxID=2592622 RepID=UPI0011DECAAE|nr:hypothetical protein [Stappia sp. BW2]TYC65728.1 hypothetical protein FMN63_25490 [Stappia sp. BW2]